MVFPVEFNSPFDLQDTDLHQLSKNGKSPRSVRDVEKSSAPFKYQIAEICDILEIKLDVWSSETSWEDLHSSYPRNYGPREEWALRWLLKKLEAGTLVVDRFI